MKVKGKNYRSIWLDKKKSTVVVIDQRQLPHQFKLLYLKNIKDNFTRERSKIESTEFSFSRFIVPHLMNYKGWALFMDCDQLMFTDVAELWRLRDERYAIQVCKHDYVPRKQKKFLGQVQTIYEKKNWSSVMLMNCDKCTALTPDYVNSATGLQLHQFKWLENDSLIGELPLEWNWLVGEYEKKEKVNNLLQFLDLL